VTEILTRTLVDMDLRWPLPDFDPAEQRAALAATMSREALETSLAETKGAVAASLAENVEVKEEVAALLTSHADPDGKLRAKAEAKQRKAEWEADLAATLAQKRELLAH
jgi:hypothetical protein